MDIKNKVKTLTKKYGSNDPVEICEKLGIWVYILPLGNVTGHYTYMKRKKVFFINENLDILQQCFCIAHELGHAVLHTKSNVYFNNSKTFFVQAKLENEADKFAAELLISDDFLLDYEGVPIEIVSKSSGIDVKYLRLKFNK
jgi:Zn-dependent peptidase ImmA (M78 family)